MKTYKKKGYSRNYKRKKYTRNYRNVRRSKRLMQKAGVFSSRVAPAPSTPTDLSPPLENQIKTTYYRTRMLNTVAVINSLDKIAANANKMDKQPLELLSKLQENFHVYYTHMLNILNESVKESVKESLKQKLQGIKDTIENIKETIEISDLKSLCNTIKEEIHRINAIDL